MKRCALFVAILLVPPSLALAAFTHEYCVTRGLYGDGICHRGCPQPDSDCLTPADPCTERGLYGDGVCQLDCPQPDPDCTTVSVVHGAEEDEVEEPAADPCADAGLYGDGPCDEHCPQADPDCVETNCPQELPYKCPDGTCAAAKAACLSLGEVRRTAEPDVQEICPPQLPHRCENGQCVATPGECVQAPVAPAADVPVAPVKREASGATVLRARNLIMTERDVSVLQDQLLRGDPHLLTLHTNNGVVSASYRRSAKLFALKTVHYTMQITVEGTAIAAETPWWLFLARDDASGVLAALQTTLEADDVVNANFHDELALTKRVMEIIAAVFNPPSA